MPVLFLLVEFLCALTLMSVSTLCMADFNVLAEAQQCDALVDKYGEKAVRQRAEAGGAEESFCLGIFHEWGTHGYSRQLDQAAKWYEVAANRGYPASGYYLGKLYEEGNGVPQDDQKAVKWYRIAAELGNTLGMDALGTKLLTGSYFGLEENHVEAAKWFHEALFNGYILAGNFLGGQYRNGDGVPKDVVVGHALTLYAEVPVVFGNSVAINVSKKNLSGNQINAAEALCGQMRSLGVKVALENYFTGHIESYCASAPDNKAAYLAFPNLCANHQH